MDSFTAMYKLEDLIEQFNNENACLVFRTIKSLLNSNVSKSSYFAILAFLNKQILLSAHRYEAIELLNESFSYLQEELIVEHSPVWIKGILNKCAKESDHRFRYEVLAKLVDLNVVNQDFHKCIVGVIPKIVDLCLSVDASSDLTKSSLRCLTVCLCKYPSTCGPFTSRIETYLCQYLALPNSPLVYDAGVAFHYLQQVGSSGPNSSNHKKNWRSQVYKLCSTLHNQYNVLFENVEEYTNYQEIEVTPFEFPSESSKDSELIYATANIIKNSVSFLNSLFYEKYPTTKIVELQHVIDVIRRGLSVDIYNDSIYLKDIQFTYLLYKHQIDLLNLLNSVILCYNQNLMIYSFTITKLIMDCLTRCHKDYFTSNSDYQEAIYKVLNQWIVLSKNKLCKSVQSKLLSHILLDIRPLKEVLYNSQELLSIIAMQSCSCLLNNVSLHLDPELYKKLCELVMNQLMDDQTLKNKSLKYRVCLYELLICIFNQNYHHSAMYLQRATYIFRNGIGNSSLELSLVCRNGLNVLEKLSQPICPTIRLCATEICSGGCSASNTIDNSINGNGAIFYENVNTNELTSSDKKRKQPQSDDDDNIYNIDESFIISKRSKSMPNGNTIDLSNSLKDNLDVDSISVDNSEESLNCLKDDELIVCDESIHSINHEESFITSKELEIDNATDKLEIDDSLTVKTNKKEAATSEEFSENIDEDELLNSLNDVVNEF